MHLETYSDKLSDMLDKNQTADDRAREKFTKEVKEYKNLVLQKDGEVVELNRKVEELTHTVREKCESFRESYIHIYWVRFRAPNFNLFLLQELRTTFKLLVLGYPQHIYKENLSAI